MIKGFRSAAVCAVFALALIGAGGTASAALITFEGYSNTAYNSPITRSGFEIGNPSGQEQHFHEITSMEYGLPQNGTGILLNDRDTQIFVVSSTPGAFSLNSVDVGAALNNFPATGLIIYGYLGGSPTGSITIGDLGTGYTTVSGASLGAVDKLLFDGTGGGGGFVLDNLNVGAGAPVPVPASLLLLAPGLAGLAAVRRRFTK